MKFKYICDDKNIVEVHHNKRTELIDKIEELVKYDELSIDGFNCYGYLEDDVVPLKLNDIERFYVENDKCYASYIDKKYQVKLRLYQIEERLTDDFIRINKSCIINKNKINKFHSCWDGSLSVELSNGDIDFISRRMLKNLKERLGL